jgi:hypothetical protein
MENNHTLIELGDIKSHINMTFYFHIIHRVCQLFAKRHENVNQPVRLGVEPLSGLMTRFYCFTVSVFGLTVFVLSGALDDERSGLSLLINLSFSVCTIYHY